MRTVIIGSGNVAEALALELSRTAGSAGVPHLVQICARNRMEGEVLAAKAGVQYTDSPNGFSEADLYIIAVSDSAIADVSSGMRVPPGAVVAHTAGSASLNAISDHIANRAVLYPLQTFTKGRTVDFRNIPIFVEYSTAQAEEVIRIFASALSDKVLQSTSELRSRVHLAAVFAANFTNHMYAVAARILNGDGLSFDTVKPLIAETTAKALAVTDPASVQTGPAVRGDAATIERHLRLLESGALEGIAELQKEIYKDTSESIWETSKKK